MKKDVKDFYEFLVNDETAQKEFEDRAKEAAADKNEEAVATFITTYAKEKGYEFSIDDIKAFDEDSEMSAEELEAVSGGKCYCVFIGAAKSCGCVFIGVSHTADCFAAGTPV